jgi:hypothetical protein
LESPFSLRWFVLRRPYGTEGGSIRFPHAEQSVTKLYCFGFDSWEDAFMGYIRGESRGQEWLFPLSLDDLIPSDHVCRVIDAFVCRVDFQRLGFVRAEAAETGRPGYDPRDLLKLYLYGYLQQIRSSRRLEAECGHNVEVMWLLGRLAPDYK